MKRLISIISLLLITASLYASLSLSTTTGVDLVHSFLFKEEITFRSAGTFGLRVDFPTWPKSSFYINPYVRGDFTTHTLTFNNTRLVGSFAGAAGLNANISIKKSLDLSLYAGIVFGYYRTVPFPEIIWQQATNNSKTLTFIAVEAGSSLIFKFDSVKLYLGSLLRYQRDSMHVIAHVGIGLENGAYWWKNYYLLY